MASPLYLLLMLLCCIPRFAEAAASGSASQRIAEATSRLATAHAREDVATLRGLYLDDAMLMPEHSPARRGRSAIADWYAAWFSAINLDRYRRDPYEVIDLGDFAIETGHFMQKLRRADRPAYEYRGKYMVLWRMDGAMPRVAAELWGADAPLPPDALPRIPQPAGAMPLRLDNDHTRLAAEITTRNALIARLVRARNGGEHATLFLPNAIYMTYYTPMLVGIAPIRAYFLEHEKPGSLVIDALELRSGHVHALRQDDLALEEGLYRVAWRDGDSSGVVTGKSLNLWKRDRDGVLKLYRQAVNHD